MAGEDESRLTPDPWKVIRDEDIEPGLISDGWLVQGENGEVIAIIANGSTEGLANALLIKGAPRLLRTARQLVSRGKPFEQRREADKELAVAVAYAEGHH
jgi:hypothetical protein